MYQTKPEHFVILIHYAIFTCIREPLLRNIYTTIGTREQKVNYIVKSKNTCSSYSQPFRGIK